MSLEFQIGPLESEKVIIGYLKSEKIGSLQIHSGYLTFSLKKPWDKGSHRPNSDESAPLTRNWRSSPCWHLCPTGTLDSSIYSQPAHVSCSTLSSLQQLPVLQEQHNPFTVEDMNLQSEASRTRNLLGKMASPRDFEKLWQTSVNDAFPHFHEILE